MSSKTLLELSMVSSGLCTVKLTACSTYSISLGKYDSFNCQFCVILLPFWTCLHNNARTAPTFCSEISTMANIIVRSNTRSCFFTAAEIVIVRCRFIGFHSSKKTWARLTGMIFNKFIWTGCITWSQICLGFLVFVRFGMFLYNFCCNCHMTRHYKDNLPSKLLKLSWELRELS